MTVMVVVVVVVVVVSALVMVAPLVASAALLTHRPDDGTADRGPRGGSVASGGVDEARLR